MFGSIQIQWFKPLKKRLEKQKLLHNPETNSQISFAEKKDPVKIEISSQPTIFRACDNHQSHRWLIVIDEKIETFEDQRLRFEQRIGSDSGNATIKKSYCTIIWLSQGILISTNMNILRSARVDSVVNVRRVNCGVCGEFTEWMERWNYVTLYIYMR